MFAEEAMAEDDLPLAKQYILLFQKHFGLGVFRYDFLWEFVTSFNISRNKSEPDLWLDFAVFCIKINDFDTALEALRETLTLDINHQIG
ncbi:hypothetical protein Phum_PHUM348110 [Pediculus humanus corporis]|uniref:Tetratricopeptide repeat protein n=1 Tax=Pediculus humanus subsp. corporis TaxID=121224 RepID=E0VNZ4_PEDHC|nr:uncharacterized protein Phum_PHUM348110 [Pediculus humanus corporis]EEB15100.1 hypothetical protein Phum_PHUM348110 [Pediculus humanus corporis]